MGAEIDRLEVQVEAQATKANNQLDKMIAKLDKVASSLMNVNNGGLSNLAAGVSQFGQASAVLNNVKTADFTRLVKNIEKLSTINTKELYGASHAMRTLSNSINSLANVSQNSIQVAQVASGISKLGGVNVQRAITNLPQLATALSGFMSTMSKAPIVSQNIIQMTDALASLAAQGGKVGSAANTTTSALDRQYTSTIKATKGIKGLSSAIGTLYQKYFWIKRIADKLYKFTGSSMDFLETVNYFEVAMRNIGDSAAKQWEENGYASAEAYAESFAKRAKQLTEKMTGYSIDSDGNATYLGVKNLGMDPDKVLQYQATFAQISSSMGVAEESALNFSKALTMLGADWASLRNLTFEQGWEKFASALAGQSRAVRTLGIDITNATLQEYAYKYGLEMAVSEMNQATKAQLRLLAILDQSKVAYGDLANTIESPANQIRMLQQNVSNLGRVFGNLFLPILQVTLPYINGVTIALQNLMIWLGKLLGIKFDAINSSTGGISDDIAGIADGADDVGGALDGANESAKKLNKTLRNWDEINNITTKDNSGSSGTVKGGGNALLDDEIAKALEDYEKIWNEAFDRMENKAQKFAGKIEKYLKPLKDIIEDFSVGDFFKAGQDTSLLVTSIFDFFSKAIDDVDWEQVGSKIGDFIAGLDWVSIIESAFKLKFNIWKAIAEAWFGSFEAAPIETSIITAIGLLKFTKLGPAIAPKLASAIMSNRLVKEMTKAWNSLGGIGGILTTDIATIAGAGTLAEIGMTIGTGIIGGIAAAFVGFNVGKEIGKWLSPEDADIYDNFTWLGKGGFFDTMFTGDLQSDFEDWYGGAFLWGQDFWKEWDNSVGKWWDTSVVPMFSIDRWIEQFGNMNPAFESSFNSISEFWDTNMPNFWSENVSPWFTKEKWEKLGENAKTGLKLKWTDFTSWWEDTGIPEWWDNNVSPWFTLEKWIELGQNIQSGLSDSWNGFTSWWEDTGFYNWWNNDVYPYFISDKWTWSGIEEGLSKSFDNAIAAIKKIWNTFAEWLNNQLNIEWESFSIGGSEIIPAGKLNLGKIPTFYTGGFPEDGLFMANHTELVGRFSNGKTAVANNEQITDGISDAVRDANYEQNQLLREQNQLLRAILEKDTGISTDDIGRSARQYAREYWMRTGDNAYNF